MRVRKIIREWGGGGVERGETPSKQAHPTWLIVSQKKHMDNDDITIGIIFQPSDEGIRNMKALWYVISFWSAICQLT
jgi:hypothetical protein